jgi:hypothetical protein
MIAEGALALEMTASAEDVARSRQAVLALMELACAESDDRACRELGY